MSTGMEQLRQAVAEYLTERGINAVTAWPVTPREESGPVVVVCLRGCQMEPSGFQDYLGECYHQDSGVWEERFGRKARLTFGLDIFSAEKGDADSVQKTFDALAGALILGGPAGICLERFSSGETEYDRENRRLRRPVQAVCTAYLSAAARTEGGFVDFELRGVVKQ